MEASNVVDARLVGKVVELLRASRSVLFITGAGLSADSGLPTYRGVGGLYVDRNVGQGMPIEVLLSAETLESRPELVWKYLQEAEKACPVVEPNGGHEVIAEIESAFDRVWVLTQNVDGLHGRAGSRNLIEIHGRIHRVRCVVCPHNRMVPDYAGLGSSPRCPECNGPLRPDVVLFGEPLPARQLAAYQANIPPGFDLVFSIGTTSVFPYISAPVLDAYHFGKPTVEINPGKTDVSEFVTVKLPCGAAAALEAVWDRYKSGWTEY